MLHAAGVQGLMEAMACQRPVIITKTVGLASYISDEAFYCVPARSPEIMSEKILEIQNSKGEADRRAGCGYKLAQQRHTLDGFVAEVANHLKQL